MPAHNPFKTALAAGQPRIGLWLSMADPYLAEAAATCGYDWPPIRPRPWCAWSKAARPLSSRCWT
jgi:hypothetical protein